MLFLLLKAGPWVIVADGSDIPGGNRDTVEILNHVAAYAWRG
jgi:hypothetical protein